MRFRIAINGNQVDIGYHYPVADLSSTGFWTDPSPVAEQMARAIMTGTGATVVPGSASYTGANVASGFFGNGSDADLLVEEGVMLCSGDIGLAYGPNERVGENNDLDETGSHPGADHGLPGDTQLNLLGNFGTRDASIFEFDIDNASTLNLTFNYVFASEEYHYYIGPYNDIMAIWVDGVNVAVVPPSTTPSDPVGVNLIHDGNPYEDPESDPRNAEYFRDNELPQPTLNIQYNGLTTLLTTTPVPISPGPSHRIKIAIADATDWVFDSAVFIQAQTSCP